MKNINKYSVLAIVVGFCYASVGVVLHSGYEPGQDWSDRPPSSVCGRWGANASCVVISSDCVLTTNHQGGGKGSSVIISGNLYKVARVERFENHDVRVAKLALADFDDYMDIYTGESEVAKAFVVAGYGKSRGAELKTPLGDVYGYKWTGTSNHILRWGTNMIDSISSSQPILIADFNAPDSNATAYEATIAEWDSGGGWFIKVGGNWQLAGISYSVTTHPDNPSQSWFKDPSTGQPAADKLLAHRISSYSDWITQTAAKLANCGSLREDINEDCQIDQADIKQLASWWCSPQDPNNLSRTRADVNSDSAVDFLDFARISKQWQGNYW